VTACIVLKQKDQRLEAASLKAFLKTHLASFKVPKEFIILDELPKGSTGKILKRELKKQITDMKKQ
jgi:long-chain acyl-CoA synthetase